MIISDHTKDRKVDILLSALEERYNALRTIRERVQSIGIWALGILFAAGAWFIQVGEIITPVQKLLYISGALIAFAVLRFKYLSDLRVGFNSQQRVAARLEKALGFFTPGLFDDGKDSMYPPTWEHAGTKKGDGKFFQVTYRLLYVGVIFLVAAIILNGSGWF